MPSKKGKSIQERRSDRQTLRVALMGLLQQNCSQSNTKLARRLNIPLSTLIRLRGDLERDGDIKAYKAILNASNFGLTTLAFVRIKLEDETEFRATLAQLNAHPEIQEIHTIGEGYDFLIKIRVLSNERLWLFLQEQLSPENNIKRTDTMIVMGSPKETSDLPIKT